MRIPSLLRKRSSVAAQPPTDDELMRKIQSGSKQAYLELYDRYEGPVFAYCRRVIDDGDRAADVFQESFVRLWEKSGSYRSGNFEAWLFTIVRNLCRDDHKRRNKLETLDAIEEQGAVDAHDMLERDAIAEALARLPEELREAIVLREYEGFSYQEIAELTGQTLSSVGVRIFRAKQQLRVLLAPLLDGNQ